MARLPMAVPPVLSGLPEMVLTRLAGLSISYSNPTKSRQLSRTCKLVERDAQHMPDHAKS